MARERNRNTRGSLLSLVVVFVLIIGVTLARNGMLPISLPGDSPSPAALPAEGTASVTFLDVGQGDSQLIQIPDGEDFFNVLIDSGESQWGDTVLSILSQKGVDELDALVVTHPHADHVGAMGQVLSSLPVKSVYMPEIPESQTPTTKSYEDFLDGVLSQNLTITPISAGMEIPVPEGAQLLAVAPEKGETFEDLNNYSAVLRFQFGNTAFLFTGDSEEKSETLQLQENRLVSADVLKCGHHGSSSSTSPAYFTAVSPSMAVISCGVDNSYGHPHQETMDLLEKSGVTLYRTDTQGAITMETDGETITVSTEKE